MDPIVYIDRALKRQETEKVYCAAGLKFLYGNSLISRLLGRPLLYLFSHVPFISALYGYWQKRPWTSSKIKPFIEEYKIDSSEFLQSVESFHSFNDFFIRKLKPEARLISSEAAIIPADGRYRVYPRIDQVDGFIVKGQKFDLTSLLENETLANQYAKGSMVMARLCPSDTHRYVFPCDCTPGETQYINGWLYSVNPIAVKRNINIFTMNKRTLCALETNHFGKVLFMEIGATNVGSIYQTYTPNRPYRKGEEKGYFGFGASALILLFEEGRITLDSDLVANTNQGFETRCLIGQPLGIH